MKLNYFSQPLADPDDLMLKAAIRSGYVPATCLLTGSIVIAERLDGNDPCAGCNGPREKCLGRPRATNDLTCAMVGANMSRGNA
jgi:hypothetical protein